MTDFLIYLISSIFSVIFQIYDMGILLKRKVYWKSKKTWIIIALTSIVCAILFKISDNFIRVMMMASFLVIANYRMFNENFVKILVAVFFMYVFYSIVEIFFASFTMYILQIDSVVYGSKFFGNFVANVIISLGVVLLVKIPIICKNTQKIINMHINNYLKISIAIFGILIIVLSIYSAYFKLDSFELILIMLIYIGIYMFVIFSLFHEKNEREITENKNNLLIENIAEYENIIELQKIEAHENINQLRIIKAMIKEEDKDLNEYVDVLLKEYKKKDKNLLRKVENIPNSGLRALIYAKLVNIQNDFQIGLVISRTVDTKILSSISSELNVDICKILGVFLDNALEAAKETKNKILGIELYVEKTKLYIKISNSFSGNIDLERMDEPRFSTKGQNRGYGLSLVKQLIEKNSLLSNQKKITGNLFTQVLIVDLAIKKTKN